MSRGLTTATRASALAAATIFVALSVFQSGTETAPRTALVRSRFEEQQTNQAVLLAARPSQVVSTTIPDTSTIPSPPPTTVALPPPSTAPPPTATTVPTSPPTSPSSRTPNTTGQDPTASAAAVPPASARGGLRADSHDRSHREPLSRRWSQRCDHRRPGRRHRQRHRQRNRQQRNRHQRNQRQQPRGTGQQRLADKGRQRTFPRPNVGGTSTPHSSAVSNRRQLIAAITLTGVSAAVVAGALLGLRLRGVRRQSR